MTPRVRVRVAARDEAGVAVPGEGGRLPVGGCDGEAVGRVHDERPRGGRTGTGRRSPTGSHDRTGEHGEGGGGGGGPGSTVGGTRPAGGRGARTRGPAGEPGLQLGRVRARRANPYSRTSGTGGAGTDRSSAPGATAMLRARPVPPAGGDSRAPSRAAACVHLNRAVSLGIAHRHGPGGSHARAGGGGAATSRRPGAARVGVSAGSRTARRPPERPGPAAARAHAHPVEAPARVGGRSGPGTGGPHRPTCAPRRAAGGCTPARLRPARRSAHLRCSATARS